MPKRYILVVFLMLMGLFVALVNILVHLTQVANIQVIFFQSLYWISDQVWGLGRAIIILLVATAASAIAIVYYRELNNKLNTKWFGGILLFSIFGLILGLIVHYAYACCDTPIIFYLGFPLSWMRGVTSFWRSLPTSASSYLIHYFRLLSWHLVLWHLFADFLFWFDIGFILFAIRNRK